MTAPETLTLASLGTATFSGPRLGVLGDPIAHSLSPAMHGAAIAELGATHPALAGLRYHRLHSRAAELPASGARTSRGHIRQRRDAPAAARRGDEPRVYRDDGASTSGCASAQ
jgi:hypothetical protein